MKTKRGEIWVVDLNPGFSKEIRKRRPALIISTNIFNESLPTVIIVPFSTKVPTEISAEMVLVTPDKNNNLDKKSVLLPVGVRAVDKIRLIERIGILQETHLEEVEEALKLVLGLVYLES